MSGYNWIRLNIWKNKNDTKKCFLQELLEHLKIFNYILIKEYTDKGIILKILNNVFV